ncbi:hypothetical protein AX14_004412 [Amanita brunnescens Koide BX004]|nr:hypothetical protein AX14_004412 [Amanita brunnescens Koide BX004]
MGHHHNHRHHRDFAYNEDHYRAYEHFDRAPHKAKLSHELVAGAVSYYAAKKYNEHCAQNGHPVNHQQAKQIFAGFAGAFLDRMIETKGLDYLDRRKALEYVSNHGDGHFGSYY